MKEDWDESLPMDIHSDWTRYYSELPLLNNVVFRRKTITEIQLHGFCDASEKAHGASIYLRTIDEKGRTQISLLVAKSKVDPLKRQTIPRTLRRGTPCHVSRHSQANFARGHRKDLFVDRQCHCTALDQSISTHALNVRREPHR